MAAPQIIPFGPVGYITAKRTYSRRLKETATSPTEEFEQVIDRVIKGIRTQLKVGFTPEEESELRDIFLTLKGSVAGRFLWQLGTKTVDRLGMFSLQNCAATVVNEPIRPFTWAMDALMLGSGVGYNIQRENVYQIPALPKAKVKITRQDTNDADFIVPDSREGWVELLRKALEAHFITGKGFSYSTVCVRGKGAPIKGFGGVASGPEELCWGINEISKVLQARAGKKLRPIDALDVMNIIGFIVVSGNVRRSAQIAIGDMDDSQFLNAKRWDLGDIPNWRAMSNNSVVCNDFSLLPEQFWQGYQGNGEPYGLINLNLSRSVGRLGETEFPDPDVEIFNPCVTGDTEVLTKFGYQPIESLVGMNIEIWNGFEWSAVTPSITGKNQPLYKVTLSNGRTLRCTSAHKWVVVDGYGFYMQESRVETKNLVEGMKLLKHDYPVIETGDTWDFDAYTQGLYAAEGSANRSEMWLYGEKQSLLQHVAGKPGYHSGNRAAVYLEETPLPKNTVPHSACLKQRLDWFAGLCDGDGTITKDGNIQVSSVDLTFLLETQKMLTTCGVDSKVSIMNEAGLRSMPDGKVGSQEYLCQTSYRLMLSAASAVALRELGMSTKRLDITSLSPNRDASRFVTVKSVEYQGIEPVVYCFTEPLRNLGCFGGTVTGQCAEQSLANFETCCLAEVFLPNIESKEELLKVCKYLYRINKHSLRLPSHAPETEAIVHKNMRMGIGVTGYMQCSEEQKSWLKDTYRALRAYDVEYSAMLGWPVSIKLTTVKPSGCSRADSLIVTSDGILRLNELGETQGQEWQEITGKTENGNDITKFYINGKVPTKIITTKDGFVYESSLNHRYWVDGKWKSVSDLSVGDSMTAVIGGYKKHSEPELSFISDSYVTNAKQISQPSNMNPDLAFFLGLYLADGSNHDKGIRISFNRKNNDQIVLLKTIVKEQFGLEGDVDEHGGFYVNSMQLKRWLDVNGCEKNFCDNISIPPVIRRSSKESIRAFITGFWRGDGGQHNLVNWSVCSVSKPFALELAVLMRAIGYNASVTNAGPGGLGKLDRWIVLSRACKPSRYQSSEFKRRFLPDGGWADPIVSIENSECETFDIEVADTHRYTLNGAVSHNTLSLIPGVTPGVHPGYSMFFIRRIRMASNIPLVELCRINGYPVEFQKNFDGSEDKNTVVVSFPCRYPEGTICAKDVTAVDQLNFIKRLQSEWSDNSVSCTVYYKRDELEGIKQWLAENYNNGVKTVSFLLHSDHGFIQAPYEEISEEQYNEMSSKVKPIMAGEVSGDVSGLDECASGACPIK